MLRTLRGVAALAAVVTLVAPAGAEVVGFWSFNNNNLPGGGFGYLAVPSVFPLAAEVGAANLTIGGGIVNETTVNGAGDTVYSWIQSFGGTTVNAPVGVIAGGTLSLQGGTVGGSGPGNNGAYFEIAFSMVGRSALDVSYATRGSSASAFTSQTWSWSTDGVNFTDFHVVTGTTATAFFAATLPTLSALDGAATAYLRVVFAGATSATSNNRLDNLTLTAVPAPGAIALLGVAGLVGRRRR